MLGPCPRCRTLRPALFFLSLGKNVRLTRYINMSLQQNSALPCDKSHGKGPYTHGKVCPAKHPTAKHTLSCAWTFRTAKSFAVRSVVCRACKPLPCGRTLPCGQAFAVPDSFAVRAARLPCVAALACGWLCSAPARQHARQSRCRAWTYDMCESAVEGVMMQK
jgi:hypothetical protein